MPLFSQREQAVHLRTRESQALRCALHFHKMSRARHHHVHVGVAGCVFGVFQIQQRHALHDAHRDGGHGSDDGRLGNLACSQQAIDSVLGRDKSTGNGSGTRSAIGLQHIAIELDRAFTELLQVKNGAHGTANQSLYLLCAAALLAPCRLTVVAGMGSTGQHAVLGRDPALTAPTLVRWHFFFNGRRAQHFGRTEFDQHRTFRVHGVPAGDAHGAQFVCSTRTASDERGHALRADERRMASLISAMERSIASSSRSSIVESSQPACTVDAKTPSSMSSVDMAPRVD